MVEAGGGEDLDGGEAAEVAPDIAVGVESDGGAVVAQGMANSRGSELVQEVSAVMNEITKLMTMVGVSKNEILHDGCICFYFYSCEVKVKSIKSKFETISHGPKFSFDTGRVANVAAETRNPFTRPISNDTTGSGKARVPGDSGWWRGAWLPGRREMLPFDGRCNGQGRVEQVRVGVEKPQELRFFQMNQQEMGKKTD
ncbi:unnamed protein product [Camellia sinensis]